MEHGTSVTPLKAEPLAELQKLRDIHESRSDLDPPGMNGRARISGVASSYAPELLFAQIANASHWFLQAQTPRKHVPDERKDLLLLRLLPFPIQALTLPVPSRVAECAFRSTRKERAGSSCVHDRRSFLLHRNEGDPRRNEGCSTTSCSPGLLRTHPDPAE